MKFSRTPVLTMIQYEDHQSQDKGWAEEWGPPSWGWALVWHQQGLVHSMWGWPGCWWWLRCEDLLGRVPQQQCQWFLAEQLHLAIVAKDKWLAPHVLLVLLTTESIFNFINLDASGGDQSNRGENSKNPHSARFGRWQYYCEFAQSSDTLILLQLLDKG